MSSTEYRCGKTVIDLKEGPYKGLLLIKCDGCEKIYGCYSKEATYSTICKECGEESLLENLKIAHFKCPNCGKYYRYLTNIKDRTFTHDCNKCESPVDMEFDKRKMCYYPIGTKDEIVGNKRSKK